ncbi:hypothetical protein CDL15_Pgr027321 [Punica granatum]|uniref:Uncharacterized protein n=1 Tax=Punica granatum TaxID=22663 RepID=A0A218WC30_PUNGR|nr:hypothetical protein CDL15_Pgr027321 [Punica granatum]
MAFTSSKALQRSQILVNPLSSAIVRAMSAARASAWSGLSACEVWNHDTVPECIRADDIRIGLCGFLCLVQLQRWYGWASFVLPCVLSSSATLHVAFFDYVDDLMEVRWFSCMQDIIS